MRFNLHRCLLLLLLPLGMALGARGQVTLVTEDFNTDGDNGARYTSNSATIDGQQYLDPANGTTHSGFSTLHYFIRSDFNPPRYPNTSTGAVVFGTATTPYPVYNPANTALAAPGFWACEGVRGAGGISAGPYTDPGTVTLNAVSVANYTGLQVQVKLAEPRAAVSTGLGADDKLRIEYSMDNGPWTTVGLFRKSGTVSIPWTSANPTSEVLYASSDPAYRTLNRAFQVCTYNIPDVGSSLRVRVTVDQFGSTKETAFDDLTVLGTVSAVTPPGLANINPGSTDVLYTEGQASPVQITNSITASYSTNLTGATVQLTTGFKSGQDVLNFSNQNGITGTYNGTTGVLALTGTATPAAYTTALRSITYSNSNTATATGGRRTVRFNVFDGSNSSTSQSRDVVVTAILAGPAAMPYTEDFTTDGEGTRYATNTFNYPASGVNSDGLGWFRTNVNPLTGYTPATFSNISNGYYWYGEGTKNVTNPDPTLIGYLQTQTIDASSYRNLHYQVRLAQGDANQWESNDYLKFYYRVGSGSWVLFGAFYGNGAPGNLQRDADLNGTADTGGTVLTNALTNIDFVLPATLSGIIDFRTELSSNGQEEMAMDLIQVTGTQIVAPTVTTGTATSLTTTTASISNSTLASDGGASLSDYGVVYVLGTGTPTTSNTKAQAGNSSPGSFPASFTVNLSGLAPGTTYTARAYATNSVNTSYGANVTFTTPTTVSSITTATASPTNATSISYTVTFGASVTGVTISNFTLTTSGLTGATISSVAGSGTTYTVVVNTGTGSGTLQLSLANSSGITPSVSNVPFAGPTTTIDKTAPTIASVAVPANGTYRAGQVLSFTVNFSEAVTVTGTPQLGLTIGSTVRQASYASGSGSTALVFGYTVVSGDLDTDGIALGTLALNGGTIQDAVGNNATLTLNSVASTTGVLVDAVAPTVTLTSSTVTNGGTTTTSPVSFTAQFSESVGSTFTASGITVSGGTVSGFTANSSPANSYSFSVTPTASTVVVSIAAGVAQDAAGNNNTASTPVAYSFTYTQPVTAAPTVTAPANNSTPNTTTPTYSGTAPANSTVTVYVDGTSIGTTIALAGGTFSLTQPTPLAQGSHTVRATAQSSGSTVSASSNTNTFTVDTVAPTATISSSAGTSGSSTGTTPLPFSVTFSEPVTGFSASGITVTNGTVVSGSLSGSGAGPYTFSVTPTTAGTATTVTIAANAAQDAASNGSVASSPYSLTYVAPVTMTTWTGNVSQDWFMAGNWTAGVPTSTIDALIPTGRPLYPVIGSGAAATRNLTNNGSITQGAGTITVSGSLFNSGSIVRAAGTIAVTGNFTSTGSLIQSAGDVTIGGSLTNNSSGTISQAAGTIAVTGNLTNNGSFATGAGTVLLGSATGASSNIFGSAAVRFWNLTIQASGAQLSTSAGASVQRVLTLTGNFNTNGNVFTIESASTGDALVVNNPGMVVGNATVQRYIDPSLNRGPGYRHYSAPVSTSTVADLTTTGFTPIINPNYNTSATPTAEVPFPNVYGYDEQRVSLPNNLGGFDKGYFSPTTLSDPLVVGRGYTVNIPGTELVDFVGTLNNNAITINMTSKRTTYPDGGWHLLGNPYPAPLDYSLVASADKMNLDGAIYVYSSTSQYGGQYRVYNNGVGNSIIPMGQGFFARVAVGATSGSLTFRNSQRLTVPNGTTFQRTAETRPLVQLTLQGAGSSLTDELYVYTQAGATASFDTDFDALKLPNTTGLNLSSQAMGQQLAIDGQPELGTTQRVVPLAVGVPAPGSYTLSAAQLLNLTNVPVYLRDRQTGALIDLVLQPNYSFVVSNASALVTGRFELVFSPQQVLATVPPALAQQVLVYPNPATTAVAIELPLSLSHQAVTATLIDAVGRTVRTQVLPAGLASHTLPISDLATGVYVLRLNTEAGLLVKKLVIE